MVFGLIGVTSATVVQHVAMVPSSELDNASIRMVSLVVRTALVLDLTRENVAQIPALVPVLFYFFFFFLSKTVVYTQLCLW